MFFDCVEAEGSLLGKILVFKTLALSIMLYACSMKIPSKQLIDQLYVLHKNFIWDRNDQR